MEDPWEVTLDQLGLDLFVSSPFAFHWRDGYLFSYAIGRGEFYDEEEKEIISIKLLDSINYLKTTQHRFVELNTEDATIRLIDRPDGKVNTALFPIMFYDSPANRLIIKKIKEVDANAE
jgi:hypothetical protein